jgi:hypothetical protein
MAAACSLLAPLADGGIITEIIDSAGEGPGGNPLDETKGVARRTGDHLERCREADEAQLMICTVASRLCFLRNLKFAVI